MILLPSHISSLDDHAHYVRMVVTDNGQPAGTAETWFTIGKDGGLTEVIAGKIRDVAVIERNSYDRNGRPLTRSYTYETLNSKQVLECTYGKKAVLFRTVVNDKPKASKTIPIPRSANLASKAVFWFKRDQPGKGAQVKWDALNIQTLKWNKASISYLGESKINLDQGPVMSRKIVGTYGSLWVNDRGEDLMMQVHAQGHDYRYISQK